MQKTLFSPDYIEQNRKLHEMPGYGTSSDAYIQFIVQMKKQFNIKTVLDYGCGKGLLKPALKAVDPTLKVYEYDPAIPGKERCRDRADLVVCGDVLEHIEPEYLNNVLTHIKSIFEKCALLVVDHMPAVKTLPDGRNAHLIQEPMEWWEAKFREFFRSPVILQKWVLPENPAKSGKTLFMVKAR